MANIDTASGRHDARARYWLSPTIWLTILAGFGFLAIGLRAVLAPTAMSAAFGLPMVTETETAFVQVYGSRTIMLALLTLLFMLRRHVRAAATVLTLAVPLPLFDAWLLASRTGFGAGQLRHLGYLVLLSTLAILLWRKFGREGAAG